MEGTTLSLKHMAVLCLIFVILGVVAVWGLNSVTYRGESSPVEVETTYGPVKLTMKLEKTTYKLGEPVNVTLTITNISNETTLLYFTIPCKTNFVILNKSSETIFEYYWRIWPTTTAEVILDSGESLTQTLTWNQLEIDDFPSFHSRQVQPGTYYIIGQIGPPLTYVGPPEEFDPEHGCPTIETSKVEINII
jgi:hypothetical protein